MDFTEIATGVGVVSALVTIVGVLITLWTKALSKLPLPGNYSWGKDVSEAVRNAKSRIWILQTWIPNFQRAGFEELQHALEKNTDVKFRVLLLAPELVKYRLRARVDGLTEGMTDQNIGDIKRLKAKFNKNPENPRVEAKEYEVLPFGPVYILDNQIYWGIYTAHQDALKLKPFKHSVKSTVGKAILASFEAVWHGGVGVDFDVVEAQNGTDSAIDEELKLEALKSRFDGRLQPSTKMLVTESQAVLVLVRAASTDFGAAGLIAGNLDARLNKKGREQASSLVDKLGVLRPKLVVWSSPIKRAWDTAQIAFPNQVANIQQVDELRERSMGEKEGLFWPEPGPQAPVFSGDEVFAKPYKQAESLFEVATRVESILADAIDNVRDGTSVVLFTHRVVIEAIAYLLGGKPSEEEITEGETWVYTR